MTPPHKCDRCGSFARTPTGECLDCELRAQPATTSPPAHRSRTAARDAVRRAAHGTATTDDHEDQT